MIHETGVVEQFNIAWHVFDDGEAVKNGDVDVSAHRSTGVGSRNGEHRAAENFRWRTADFSVGGIKGKTCWQAWADGPGEDFTITEHRW